MPMPMNTAPRARSAPTEAAPVAVADHWIEQPHGRLFARSWTPRHGAGGNPFVLLHDSLGCVELWRAFPAQLAAATGRRVVAYDRLGFGRSQPCSAMPALDFVAQEAHTGFAALRAQLGIDGFVVLGHSVGGGMAVHVAAGYPQACEALVTESAQVFAEDRTLQGIAAARDQFADPEQFARLQRYHGERTAWVLQAWTGSWLSPAFAGWSLEPVLPTVRCPLLAIHGLLDEFGSEVHPKLLTTRCAGPARMALMADTGHLPHRERAAEVVAMIRAFIEAPPR